MEFRPYGGRHQGSGTHLGGWPDWSDKTAALRDARFDLGAGGIVKVFSALDVFIEALEGEMQAWAAAPNRQGVINHPDAKGKHDVPLIADRRTAGEEDSGSDVDDESDLMKTRALKVYQRHGEDLSDGEASGSCRSRGECEGPQPLQSSLTHCQERASATQPT